MRLVQELPSERSADHPFQNGHFAANGPCDSCRVVVGIVVDGRLAEIRPLPRAPAGERPVGIDRGMKIPDSFFKPLPDEMLRAFDAQDGPL